MPALPLALQAQNDFVDPYAGQRAAVAARLAQAYPEAYSADEQQKRITDNDRLQALGILGQLSGDTGAGAVGGLLLKNALKAREPYLTDKGVGDPLTGRFSYNSAYRQERDQGELDKIDAASAAARGRYDEGVRRSADAASLAMTLKGMSGGGGGNGGGVKATLEGFDPDTGLRVVTDKQGQTFRIGPDGRQVPHQGAVVPKGDWEKNVSAATESLGALQSANTLLTQAAANPGAFGLSAKIYGGVPNFARGVVGSAIGMSPAEQQTLTKVQQAAALEIHRLYGAALSAGEDRRASTFLPNPDDDAPVLLNKLSAMRDLVQSTVNRYGPAMVAQARARSGPVLDNTGQTTPGAPQATPGPARASAAPAGGGLTPQEQAELAQLRARRGGAAAGATGSY